VTDQKKFSKATPWALFVCAVLLVSIYIAAAPSLAALASVQDYIARERLYVVANRWQMLLLFPAAVFAAFACALWDPQARVARAVLSRWRSIGRRTRHGLIVIVFFIECAAFCLLIAEQTPRVFDGFNYYFQAMNFSHGQAAAPIPPAAKHFDFPFVMMYNGRWFGSSYPGWPALLALGLILGVPWLVNPLLAAAALALTIRWTRTEHGEETADLVGLLGVLSPFYIAVGGIFLSHPAALLTSLLSVYAFHTCAKHGGRWRWSVLSAAAMAMGLIIRPQSQLCVSLPFACWGLLLLIRGRLRWRVLLPFAAAIILSAGLLCWYNAATTGDPWDNPRYRVSPERRLGFGPDIGGGSPWDSGRGHTVIKGLRNTALNLSMLNSDMFGWGGGFFLGPVLLGMILPVILRRVKLLEILLLGSFAATVALYIAYFTPSPNFGPRYYYETIPAVLILTASGLGQLARNANGSENAQRKAAVFFLLVFLTAGSLSTALPRHLLHYSASLPPIVQRTAVSGLDEISNAVVLVAPPQFWANVFLWNSPNLDESVIYALDVGPDSPREIRAAFPNRKIYRLVPGADRGRYQLIPVIEGLHAQ